MFDFILLKQRDFFKTFDSYEFKRLKVGLGKIFIIVLMECPIKQTQIS